MSEQGNLLTNAYLVLATGFREDYLHNIELIETLEEVYIDKNTWPDTKEMTKECLGILYKMRDENERKAQRYRALSCFIRETEMK